MKNFFKNKTAVRVGIYTVLFAAAEILRTLANNRLENKHFGELFLALEILFSFLVLKNALALVIKSTDARILRLKSFVKKVKDKILAPVEKLFSRKDDPNALRIRGRDERTVIIPWKLSHLLKKQRNSKEKITLKNCKSNTEIIRMLYASFILKLNHRGCEIKTSRTPREVKNDVRSMKDFRMMKIQGIFNIYEEIRYQRDPTPDDRAVQMCREDEELFG